MLDKVLVAFDGSGHARRACELGTEVAGRFHATLTVVVVRASRDDGVDSVLEDLVPLSDGVGTLAAVLDEIRELAVSRGAAKVEVVSLRGDALDELLAWLDRHPQDLIVVGSRGLSRGRRILLGSVSTGLVSRAPCPVMVVRGRLASHPHLAPTPQGTRSAGTGRRAASVTPPPDGWSI